MTKLDRYLRETRVAFRFGLAFFILCAAAFLGIRQFSYMSQDVTIDDVRILCHLGWGKNDRYDTPLTEDCDALRTRLTAAPEYRGFHFKKETYVYFQYLSPADSRSHPGRLVRARNEAGGPIIKRDIIAIRVSRLNPGHYID